MDSCSASTKETLYAHCVGYVNDRIKRIQEELEHLRDSSNESTKSSMGDKYETGRAMSQLEIERAQVQLIEAEKLRADLHLLPPVLHKTDSIAPGSLVTTTTSIFYLAISIGAVPLDQQTCFVVSPQSPIGKLLLGKQVGDTLEWNDQPHTVLSIE